MPVSAPVIALSEADITTQIAAFKRILDQLKTAETGYQKAIDAMYAEWKGSSGKNFAEAAGRVKAGFVANRTALEQLIYEISNVQKILSSQDESGARSINAIDKLTL